MEKTATPTPWRVVRRSNQQGVRACWLTNDRGISLEPQAHESNGVPGVLNQTAAAMDVLAARANAHDRLVAALREGIDTLNYEASRTDATMARSYRALAAKHSALLAEIEGQS